MKKRTANMLLWVLTGFMAISAVIYFPSVASIIMLLFSSVSIPIERVQNFWRAKKLSGITKGILLTVLFFVSVGLAPNTRENAAMEDNSQNISGDVVKGDLATDKSDNTSLAVRSGASDEQKTDVPEEQQPETKDDTETLPEPEKEEHQESSPTPEPAQESEQKETTFEETSLEATTQTNQKTPESQPDNTHPSNGGNGDNFNTYSNEEQQKTEASYVLNTSTMKIHYPSCSQVKKISPKNYSTSNLSESELLAQGYTTCGVCH